MKYFAITTLHFDRVDWDYYFITSLSNSMQLCYNFIEIMKSETHDFFREKKDSVHLVGYAIMATDANLQKFKKYREDYSGVFDTNGLMSGYNLSVFIDKVVLHL